MKRILFLDQYGSMGGGQTVLLSLLRAALPLGALTVLAPPGPLQDAVKSLGDIDFVAVAEQRLRYGRKGLGDLFGFAGGLAALTRHLPLLRLQDIIYVNGLRHLPAVLLLAPLLKARFFFHVHLDHSGLEKALIRFAARRRRTSAVITNSTFVQQRLSAQNSVLVENALDQRFAALPFRNRFIVPPTQACIFGTLRPEKGQDVAIAAVADLPELHLKIIGRDGSGVDSWITGLRRSAPANVHFDGATNDVAARLDTLGIQLNLVPSQWNEPFGLAAIEGMACSCLTIVSGKGGLERIAALTGAPVAVDAYALRQVLVELMEQPAETLTAIARSQYDAAQAAYAPARFEAQIRRLLEAALKDAPASL